MNSTTDDLARIKELTNIGLLLTRYSLMILVVFGVIGNCFNILIFLHAKFRSNPCSFYFLSAAIANLIFLIGGVMIRMLGTFGYDLSEKMSGLCKLRQFIVYIVQSLSTSLLGLATFDRFLISSSKVEYRNLSSLRNAQKLVAFLTIIYFLIYAEIWYCVDATGTPPQPTCTTVTTRACGLYNEIARLITLVMIPMMLLLIFGYKTFQNIKKIQVNIAPVGTNQRGIRRTDRQLIQMLAGQNMLLIIAYIPHVILRVYSVVTLDMPKTSIVLRIETLTGQVTLVTGSMEAGFSFFVYVLFGGSLFRETLKIMIAHIIPINNRGVNSRN